MKCSSLLKTFGLCGLLLGSSCSHNSHNIPADSLSEQAAQLRKAQIQNVHYELAFELSESEPNFSGMNKLHFDLNKTDEPIRIDFRQGSVDSLKVNDKAISDFSYDKSFLMIPASHFQVGANIIEIQFKHPYSTSGSGLHRFKDPEDGNTYLYTDFEPHDANELFPSFDQPNLKASYTLKVQAPAAWTVVSSNFASKVSLKGKTKSWLFPKSQKFSTYIFSLHAGPYKIWEDKAGPVPLRLMARKSLAKYVDVKEWFTITKQGLAFFNQYFGVAYPYQKYDQLIVPDFNSGAMENVAAVTFNESYVTRSKPTLAERERRANVILHEMAHMWFGNLVTMDWWNGLWLNESFATFMADLALAEATEFKHAWQTFNASNKQWAYWNDQLVTTHPIEVPVIDTKTAFTNFDGITYGKGASVLQQLHFLIGDEAFRSGLKHYFSTYGEQNTKLQDFIGSMEMAAKKDLGPWVDEWLMHESLNTITPEYSCEDGKISTFKVIQTAEPGYSRLREHRSQLALFENKQGKLTATTQIPYSYKGAITVIDEVLGKTCPDIVFLNYGDKDYVKLKFDEKSLQNIQANLSQIDNTLTRQMIWPTLWDMTRDGKYSLDQYIELALKHAHHETDFRTIKTILDNLSRDAHSYLDQAAIQDVDKAKKLSFELERYFWNNLQTAKTGSDIQKVWLDGFIRLAHEKQSLTNLHQLLTGKQQLKGLPIDQDRRWSIIKALSANGFENTSQLITIELKKDKSDLGQKSALAAEVAQPDLKVKQNWFNTVIENPNKLPLIKLKYVMWNLFPPHQTELMTNFKTSFYEKLPSLGKTQDSLYLSSLTRYLVPTLCTEAGQASLSEFLSKHDELPIEVSKNLKIAQQENGRCIGVVSQLQAQAK